MATKRPLIGCTTYRKTIAHDPLIQIDGLRPTYTGAILAAGGLPIMISQALSDDDLLELFERVDGILLPGGGDVDPARYGGRHADHVYGVDQERDRVEVLLACTAVKRGKPLFAICRGHQLLNVALGGSLWEDLNTFMPGTIKHSYFKGYDRSRLSHEVTIRPESRLARTLGTTCTGVNSIHHQGIRNLAPELSITAYAPDDVIEAVEIPEHPFALGVQWHPEELYRRHAHMFALFKSFVDVCREGAAVNNA